MPTGYTAGVVDGSITDLRTFALQCARAMGACVMMRDEPMDAPIPERFEPSDYNAKRLAEAIIKRDALRNMTEAEAEEAARAEYEAELASEAEYLEKQRVERERYQRMIDLVRPWQKAPEGLKEFMLEQLTRGMDFDCPEDTVFYKTPELLTGQEWRRGKLEKVQKSIQYHAAEDVKEWVRTEGRNAWIAQLRVALDDAEKSA